MAGAYDFAIFGASPLAALLAGLLAHDHAKRVLRIAEPLSPQRLPRAIDVALPLATRPESWRLLRTAQAETAALLASLGAPDAIAPTDVKIIADLSDTATAIAHLSHIAMGYGQAVHDGVFKRVPRLIREIVLTDSKVRQVDAAEISGEHLIVGDERIDVGQIVLADDAAILSLLSATERPTSLVAQPMTATLTAPTRQLAAPVMRFPDRGVTLMQRKDLTVLALVAGEPDDDARLASCLPGPFPLQRRATSQFRRLIAADGAPVVGVLPPGQFIVAGFGDAAAFLAPPIARLLAGKSTGDEAPWFAAHAPGAPNREAVADFVEPAP
jgi:hypothetical protein